ncbi:MAG: putative oxidoreductase CatD [Chlamydiae bacterium]|nr:putative oxidoreductase CatD [Chlamydiota bacterium]
MHFFYAIRNGLNRLWFIVPIVFRFVLSYGFIMTAVAKFNQIDATKAFFLHLNISLPILSAYLVMCIEGIGAVFLFFGFLTRLTALLLFIIMIVALQVVHGGILGPWQTDYQVPFFYALLLLGLVFGGAGAVSLDRLFFKKHE